MKIKIIIIILFWAIDLIALSPGNTSLDFLKIDTGARASGLAGAYSSYGSDPFAVFYNPALAVNARQHELAIMHYEYLVDCKYECISSLFVINDKYNLGASLHYFYSGDMDRTVSADNMEGYSTQGVFSVNDLMVVLSHGYKVNRSIDLGGNVKYIRETIYQDYASTFAVDLGIVSRLDLFLDPKVSFSMLNLGMPVKFIEKKENLPLTAKTGISFGFSPFHLNKQSVRKDLNFSVDMESPLDNKINIRAGAEMFFIDILAFRLGYKLNFNAKDLDYFSAGAGLMVKQFDLNYAFIPYKYLGSTHRFSLGVKF